MSVPVVWWSGNQAAISRGYWDEGCLEALLAGRLWPVPLPEWSHHQRPEGLAGGAVVAIPARWYAAEVEAINEALGRLEWVLLLLCGDEEGEFPAERLRHPAMACWVQTAHPGRHPRPGEETNGIRWRWFGDGWPPGTPEILAGLGDVAVHPNLDWWFHGQLNNTARERAVAAMTTRRAARNDGECHITREFGNRRSLSQEQFLARMVDCRAAVCPSGTYSPDTFRLFEALEAGRVPIAERNAPNTPWEQNYWETLFGGPPPFPILSRWDDLDGAIEQIASSWPAASNRCFGWWQGQKRRMAWEFADDLAALRNTPALRSVSQQITVLMPTSPIAAHPDTGLIERTIASLRAQLPGAEILVMCDGVRSEQAHRRRAYQEYVRRLCWKANFDPAWQGVLPVVYTEWLHQAEMTHRTLPLVRTPLVLFCEHDAPLLDAPIDWAALSAAIGSGHAQVVRLHHESRVLDEHRYLMLEEQPRLIEGARLWPTVQWSQRPHLASTDWYRGALAEFFGREARTMIEDVMYGVLLAHHRYLRMKGWERFRLFLYAPEGDSLQRSYHTDGRGPDPKYRMLFRYDAAERPLGAPYGPRSEQLAGQGTPCPCLEGVEP